MVVENTSEMSTQICSSQIGNMAPENKECNYGRTGRKLRNTLYKLLLVLAVVLSAYNAYAEKNKPFEGRSRYLLFAFIEALFIAGATIRLEVQDGVCPLHGFAGTEEESQDSIYPKKITDKGKQQEMFKRSCEVMVKGFAQGIPLGALFIALPVYLL